MTPQQFYQQLNERQTLRPEVVFLFIKKCTSAPYVDTTNALFLSHLPLS